MADQKELKKRLKVLMQRPENQVCSDCPERQPRWASLIVPPPGSPPGSTAIGAFCCLECSGSHRRLGVHISFVRSINLDSWKEKEVLAMENGGNGKVNAIWEANLQASGGRKPGTGADLTTRERFIRDKYERRRFYDPQALLNYQNRPEPSVDELVMRSNRSAEDFANFAGSDAAKARAASKKKKGLPRNKSFDAPARTKSGGSTDGGAAARRRMKRQESEPSPVIDLLDLGAEPTVATATTGATAPDPASPFADFFSADANKGAQPPATNLTSSEDPSSDDRPAKGGSRSRSKNRSDSTRTKSKTPDREKTRKTQQQDILNMYSAPMGGQAAVGGMRTQANNPINMMAMMQQMQGMNLNPHQQHHQPQRFGIPDHSAGGGGKSHNQRLAMHQNLMMQQMQAQMQQQQQNAQQMQRVMQVQGGGGQQAMGGMNPNMMGMNPQFMQAMMQQKNINDMASGGGMPLMMGVNSHMMMGMNPRIMQQQQHAQMDNQFGAMTAKSPSTNGHGGVTTSKTPEKEDPFAQFGMNAFR